MERGAGGNECKQLDQYVKGISWIKLTKLFLFLIFFSQEHKMQKFKLEANNNFLWLFGFINEN